MSHKSLRCFFLMLVLGTLTLGRGPALTPVYAQPAHDTIVPAAKGHGPATAASTATEMTKAAEQNTGKNVGPHAGAEETHGAAAHEAGHGGGAEHEAPGTFDPHAGTWLHPIARLFFEGNKPVGTVEHDGAEHFTNIKSDFIVVALFIMALIALFGILAAKSMKLRPDGKPMSLSHVVETSAEGFRNYLIGVMGPELARKYAPLVSSFFFTILLFNWMGLVPGMLAPTANPNVPIALSIVGFFCVHFIAIKEAGIKSWFMHFVGEPIWLAPLNFPLHIIGELIKPMSLSIRLLCNVFGEEMVALQLGLLAVATMAMLKLPIPFQFPMLCLGLFFGLLQALVFATLLAIYIAILATHHDDHDEHNIHGHTEHVRVHGFDEVVAHPSETPVA